MEKRITIGEFMNYPSGTKITFYEEAIPDFFMRIRFPNGHQQIVRSNLFYSKTVPQ